MKKPYRVVNTSKIHNKLTNIEGREEYPYYATSSMPRLDHYALRRSGDSPHDLEKVRKILKYARLAEFEFLYAYSIVIQDNPYYLSRLYVMKTVSNLGHSSGQHVLISGIKIPDNVAHSIVGEKHLLLSTDSHVHDTSYPTLCDFKRYYSKSVKELAENIISVVKTCVLPLKGLKEVAKKVLAYLHIDFAFVESLMDAVLFGSADDVVDIINGSITNYSNVEIPEWLRIEHQTINKPSFSVDRYMLSVTGWLDAVEAVKDDIKIVATSSVSGRPIDENLYPYNHIIYKRSPRVRTTSEIDGHIMMFKSEESVSKFYDIYHGEKKYTGVELLIQSHYRATVIQLHGVTAAPVGVKFYNSSLDNVSVNADTRVSFNNRKTFFDKNTHRTFLEIQTKPKMVSIHTLKFFEEHGIVDRVRLHNDGSALAAVNASVEEQFRVLKEEDVFGIRRYLERMKDSGLTIVFDVLASSMLQYSAWSMYRFERLHEVPNHTNMVVYGPVIESRSANEFAYMNNMHLSYVSNNKNCTTSGITRILDAVEISSQSVEEQYDRAYELVHAAALKAHGDSIRLSTPSSPYHYGSLPISPHVGLLAYFTILVGEDSNIDDICKILKKEKLTKLGNAYHMNVYPYLDKSKNIDTILDIVRYI